MKGECFCGEIQYEIKGDLHEPRSCHCSRCRKAFSGAGSAMAGVGPKEFSWLQGEKKLTLYVGKKGYGIGFCKLCGTTLCGLNKGEVMGISLGTLNDDPELKIHHHLFVGSKASWDEIGGEAPQHETWPD
jgi:hypothetical protein